MSFIAKLKLDDETINVMHCSYGFNQMTDSTGRPIALPQGGTIQLVLESTGTTHLFDWMVSPTQTKSGVITFFRQDSKSKLKVLEFSNAHCVDYHESYDHHGEHSMRVRLIISAHELKLNDSPFKNNWPE